jgi:hypothetical protein
MVDVPINIPGVPTIPGNINTAISAVASLVVADASGLMMGNVALSQGWGIYLSGIPVIIADTVMRFGYKEEWALSDYPIEKGQFETYNKVYIPFDARFRFVIGGSEIKRQALLASIAAIAGDTNLYDIVSPTGVYPSANVTHYDYDRSARQGLGLLQVDIWCLQVKTVVGSSSSTTSTQDPSATNPSDGGSVQPSDVPIPPARPNPGADFGVPIPPSRADVLGPSPVPSTSYSGSYGGGFVPGNAT